MSHHHLTRDQRVELAVLWRLGQTKAQIARQLFVHRSTIGRELGRNPYKSGYHARVAQAKAKYRRQAANRRRYRMVPDSFLAQYCEKALRCELVPEQISGRLALVFGDKLICPETIYRWIYLDRPDLVKLLRSTKHGYRRKRGTNARWFKRELDRKRHIWQRPEDIELRILLGDWEGDTVHGANHAVSRYACGAGIRLHSGSQAGSKYGSSLPRGR